MTKKYRQVSYSPGERIPPEAFEEAYERTEAKRQALHQALSVETVGSPEWIDANLSGLKPHEWGDWLKGHQEEIVAWKKARGITSSSLEPGH